jgi:hypothetical protein
MECACAILSSVASAAVLCFPNYLINGTIFGGKKVIGHKMRVLIFSATICSEVFLILRTVQGDVVRNVLRSSCKCLLFLYDFNEI